MPWSLLPDDVWDLVNNVILLVGVGVTVWQVRANARATLRNERDQKLFEMATHALGEATKVACDAVGVLAAHHDAIEAAQKQGTVVSTSDSQKADAEAWAVRSRMALISVQLPPELGPTFGKVTEAFHRSDMTLAAAKQAGDLKLVGFQKALDDYADAHGAWQEAAHTWFYDQWAARQGVDPKDLPPRWKRQTKL